MSQTGITATKNGFLYVYVSNETPNINVYFDNLQITHIKSPLLQEQSYYPCLYLNGTVRQAFGLQMAGISDKALGKLDSKNKFNGGSDFEEDYGVNLYYTDTRKYDPQIGRFLGVDELSELSSGVSVYHFAGNNPAMVNDPSGRRNQPPPDPGSPAWDFASSQILNSEQMGTYMDQWMADDDAFWGHFNSGGGSGYLSLLK